MEREKYQFTGQGTVFSFTIQEGHEYPLALIKLQEGPIITAQLTEVDYEDIYIGMPVEMVTRKLKEDGDRGLITYGYKFRAYFKTT